MTGFLRGEPGKTLMLIGAVLGAVCGPAPWLGAADDLPACRQKQVLDCGLYGISAIAFSPDGSSIFSALADGAIKVWDVNSGALSREIPDVGGAPRSLACSPDGSMLAVGLVRDPPPGSRQQWGAILIDLVSGRRKNEFWGDRVEGTQIAFMPQGKRLVVSKRGGLVVWDRTKEDRTDITPPRATLPSHIALTTVGDRVAFDSFGDIYIYDLGAKACVRARRAHRERVTALAFSPDGSLLVSGSADHEVILWQMATGKELAVFHQTSKNGCIDRVLAARFSLDGKEIVSAHLDKKVRYWDPIGHRLLRSYVLPLPPKMQLFSVVFSPDGKSLAARGYIERTGVRASLPPTWKIVVWGLPSGQ